MAQLDLRRSPPPRLHHAVPSEDSLGADGAPGPLRWADGSHLHLPDAESGMGDDQVAVVNAAGQEARLVLSQTVARRSAMGLFQVHLCAEGGASDALCSPLPRGEAVLAAAHYAVAQGWRRKAR